MQFWVKGILALFWLAVVPSAAGIPFIKKKKDYTIGEGFLAGYLFLLSLAEIFLLPAIYLDLPLHIAVPVYGVAILLMGIWGAVILIKDKTRLSVQVKRSEKEISPYLLAAIGAIALQVCIVAFFAHFDADDAFYVGTATTAVETDTLFSVNTYTGAPYTKLPSRYILSPFPVLLAIFSRLCAGLHPAIMAHVIYPLVLIPAAYMALHLMGKKWFPHDREAQGQFLLISAVVIWFSGFSVYTAGNFQLVRIWQGKAVLCAVLLPTLFYLCNSIVLERNTKYPWILLGMGNLACCHVSSMGIMLSPVMIGIFALCSIWKYKSVKRFAWSVLACIPSLILGVIYLML